MNHHLERRQAPRQRNLAGHVSDARADARRMRQVIEDLSNLAIAGQLPSASDMQAALALARITEFHAALAVRSLEDASHLVITEESMPCL